MAIFTTLACTVILSLIALGSAVAFNAISLLSVAALYSSYILVAVLLLWCRLTGQFNIQKSHNGTFRSHLTWGPWHLPEPWGSMNNLFACIYLSFIFFWSFWPPLTHVTAQTANFAVLVYGTVLLFSMVWYVLRGKHTFNGPVKEVEDDGL